MRSKFLFSFVTMTAASVLALACSRPPRTPKCVSDEECPEDDPGPQPGRPTIGANHCSLYKTTAEVEEKVIMRRCGGEGTACHAGGPFKPRFEGPGKIAMAVLDHKSQLFCTDDKYVNTAHPDQSLILAKANPGNQKTVCPTPGQAGGERMPYQQDPLEQAELDCLTWWTYQIAGAGENGGGSDGADGGAGAGGQGGEATADASPPVVGPAPTITPAATITGTGAKNQDDMAFWVHPTDKAMSTVVTSDKTASKVFVSDSAGKVLQTITPPGKPGNIDVRYGFPLGSAPVDIVAFNDRSNDKVDVYAVNEKTRQLRRVDDDAIDTDPSNYGLCLYKSHTGKFYAFVNYGVSGMGRLQQIELAADGAGKVKGTNVREWTYPTKAHGESCVVDDETATLYYSDKPNGIYEIGAEPTDPTPGTIFTKVGENDLAGDVEGLTFYFTNGGGGYLIAASQGNDTFKVYDRKKPHTFRGTFTIAGATQTDHVDVTNANVGGAFTQGCFAAHGGTDLGPDLLVKWEEIATPLHLAIDAAYDPRR